MAKHGQGMNREWRTLALELHAPAKRHQELNDVHARVEIGRSDPLVSAAGVAHQFDVRVFRAALPHLRASVCENWQRKMRSKGGG